MRIVILGAGGWRFPLELTRDVLAREELRESQIVLYDVDRAAAERTLGEIERMTAHLGLATDVVVTDDRRQALSGADVVFTVFGAGGRAAYRLDIELPRELGVDQLVGDTMGLGGIFRGLRTIKALQEICDDMLEVCPDAWLLQYTNPMAIACWATDLIGVKTVGICHSVQLTSRQLAEELGVPYDEVVFDVAGINHTAWFTTFRRGNEDLLPRLRETLSTRHGAGSMERVRTELMELTGYFHTESSDHASEYWPWFRKDPELTLSYLPERWQYFESYISGERMYGADDVVEEIGSQGFESGEDYGGAIVASLATGRPTVVYGSVRNGGAIENLSADACVEVACLVDGNGVRPVRYGSLPPACAALNEIHIAVQRLVVRAALERDPSLVHAAAALDPLTGAMLTLPEIRRLVDQMLGAQAEWLPFSLALPATVGP
jgi:alpha-galactosidase